MIGQLGAAGTEQGISTYKWSDKQPVQGSNYYRILQRDLNGRQSVSKVIKVQFGQSQAVALKVIANPVISRQLQVEMGSAQTLHLYNGAGALVLTKTVPAGRSVIALERIPAGMYYLQAAQKIVPLVVQ